MRIGFIEDTRLHGGTQIWVTEAARYFLAKSEAVTILTPEDGWVAGECAGTGARVIPYDFDDVDATTWEEALRDCDVAVCTVHPPRGDFHCSVFAAGCIRRENLKTILLPKTGTIVPAYQPEFYRPDERVRSHVIAIAEFTRQYLLDRYQLPPEQVELIYQGVDTTVFSPDGAGKGAYSLPEKAAPVLGNIGSMEHRKGQGVLLEAFREMVLALPNAHLMFVGDGPDEAMLKEKVIGLGLDDNVSFFPFTRDPAQIYPMLDLLVLPSLYKEGLPNVLLESLATGVPVVASNIAGVPEVVKEGKTGLLVEAGSSKQLADAIITLWRDQSRYSAMRQNGRLLIEEQFDKQKQFDRFLTFFDEIVR
jgi:glycosyltransferase involved in cell wall biosynthesis